MSRRKNRGRQQFNVNPVNRATSANYMGGGEVKVEAECKQEELPFPLYRPEDLSEPIFCNKRGKRKSDLHIDCSVTIVKRVKDDAGIGLTIRKDDFIKEYAEKHVNFTVTSDYKRLYIMEDSFRGYKVSTTKSSDNVYIKIPYEKRVAMFEGNCDMFYDAYVGEYYIEKQ